MKISLNTVNSFHTSLYHRLPQVCSVMTGEMFWSVLSGRADGRARSKKIKSGSTSVHVWLNCGVFSTEPIV